MLVGYAESDKTYRVRRRGGEFDVRYDAIADKAFCVLVYEGTGSGDTRSVHIKALRNAIAFAKGARYAVDKAPFKELRSGICEVLNLPMPLRMVLFDEWEVLFGDPFSRRVVANVRNGPCDVFGCEQEFLVVSCIPDRMIIRDVC